MSIWFLFGLWRCDSCGALLGPRERPRRRDHKKNYCFECELMAEPDAGTWEEVRADLGI